VTLWSDAIDAICDDPAFGVPALWRAAGAGDGVAVAVLWSAPLTDGGLGGGLDVVTGDARAQVRTAEVATLSRGDTLEVDGVVWRITGAPERDAEGLLWSAPVVREGP
jgi:hypothetical protein